MLNWTVKSLLASAKHIDPHDAEILLSHILKRDRSFLIAHPEYSVSKFTAWRFLYLKAKRKKGIPLAYLTGHKEFFRLDFLVNKYTLIPRPETESIVEELLSRSHENKNSEKICIIDVGTGSGCIPISIGYELKKLKLDHVKILATDISRGALRVAKKNAAHYSIPITFYHGNLLAPLFLTPNIWHYDHYFVTANLPYLTKKQFTEEPSIQYEPKNALIADADDGLSLYKILIQQLTALQKPLGSLTLLFEINPEQSKPITEFIRATFTRAEIKIEIIKDLAGLDRIVAAQLTPKN